MKRILGGREEWEQLEATANHNIDGRVWLFNYCWVQEDPRVRFQVFQGFFSLKRSWGEGAGIVLASVLILPSFSLHLPMVPGREIAAAESAPPDQVYLLWLFYQLLAQHTPLKYSSFSSLGKSYFNQHRRENSIIIDAGCHYTQKKLNLVSSRPVVAVIASPLGLQKVSGHLGPVVPRRMPDPDEP